MPRKIILSTRLPPGDVCTLTAALESLHTMYRGEFLTDVRTGCDVIFENNPRITKLAEDAADTLEMHYTESIASSNTVPHSFLRGYCRDLGRKLRISLELTTNRPHLYVSEAERETNPACSYLSGHHPRYWLVTAGVKNDFTLKQWPVEYFQAVVDHFRGQIQFIQVGGAEHDHPALDGVVNLVGKTDLRQLIQLAYHAEAGLGPITLLQHFCAAFEKPYVALLGGREPVSWTQYPLQTTLHTMGMLPCCQTKACWRSRVVWLEDGCAQNNSLCERPVLDLERPVGQCMAMIKPGDVIRAIEGYYEGAVLNFLSV